MRKKPLNLTLNERVIELAERIMDLRGHSSFSGFVEELIRDEYERRRGPLILKEDAPPYKVNSSPDSARLEALEAEAARKIKAAAERELKQRRQAKSQTPK